MGKPQSKDLLQGTFISSIEYQNSAPVSKRRRRGKGGQKLAAGGNSENTHANRLSPNVSSDES